MRKTRLSILEGTDCLSEVGGLDGEVFVVRGLLPGGESRELLCSYMSLFGRDSSSEFLSQPWQTRFSPT